MKISDIKNIPGMECIQSVYSNVEVSVAYTSDLMSDVMAHAPGSAVLITIQAHKNTVAVASLIDASAIIICNNRPIPREMISSAENEEIAIFKTLDNQFIVSNKIGQFL